MSIVEVQNPLDYSDQFLMNALHLTYHYVCEEMSAYYNTLEYRWAVGGSYVPHINAIDKNLSDHFVQELFLSFSERGAFESVGVDSEQEFAERIKSGDFHRFIPDRTTIKNYLNLMRLSYREEDGRLRNEPIAEVW